MLDAPWTAAGADPALFVRSQARQATIFASGTWRAAANEVVGLRCFWPSQLCSVKDRGLSVDGARACPQAQRQAGNLIDPSTYGCGGWGRFQRKYVC